MFSKCWWAISIETIKIENIFVHFSRIAFRRWQNRTRQIRQTDTATTHQFGIWKWQNRLLERQVRWMQQNKYIYSEMNTSTGESFRKNYRLFSVFAFRYLTKIWIPKKRSFAKKSIEKCFFRSIIQFLCDSRDSIHSSFFLWFRTKRNHNQNIRCRIQFEFDWIVVTATLSNLKRKKKNKTKSLF